MNALNGKLEGMMETNVRYGIVQLIKNDVFRVLLFANRPWACRKEERLRGSHWRWGCTDSEVIGIAA